MSVFGSSWRRVGAIPDRGGLSRVGANPDRGGLHVGGASRRARTNLADVDHPRGPDDRRQPRTAERIERGCLDHDDEPAECIDRGCRDHDEGLGRMQLTVDAATMMKNGRAVSTVDAATMMKNRPSDIDRRCRDHDDEPAECIDRRCRDHDDEPASRLNPISTVEDGCLGPEWCV
jgi:hypothetical protein